MYMSSPIDGENQHNSDRISEEYVCVNSCGHYIITGSKFSKFTTVREKGRSDYQMIYFWNGCGLFNLNGKNVRIDEGNLIIYKPYQPQIYTFRIPESNTKNTEVYWIHFTGSGIEDLLKKSDLWDEQIYFIGKCSEINELISKMIREIQTRPYKYELFCSSYLYELVSHVSRRLTVLKNSEINKKYEKIAVIIEAMHNNYNDQKSVEYYAEQCSLSKYHFIHLFKQYTGSSPYAYKTKIRIEKAIELLSSTTLNIQEIANIVGYSNPLYFSNTFKKNTGLSPLAYKKTLI